MPGQSGTVHEHVERLMLRERRSGTGHISDIEHQDLRGTTLGPERLAHVDQPVCCAGCEDHMRPLFGERGGGREAYPGRRPCHERPPAIKAERWGAWQAHGPS